MSTPIQELVLEAYSKTVSATHNDAEIFLVYLNTLVSPDIFEQHLDRDDEEGNLSFDISDRAYLHPDLNNKGLLLSVCCKECKESLHGEHVHNIIHIGRLLAEAPDLCRECQTYKEFQNRSISEHDERKLWLHNFTQRIGGGLLELTVFSGGVGITYEHKVMKGAYYVELDSAEMRRTKPVNYHNRSQTASIGYNPERDHYTAFAVYQLYTWLKYVEEHFTISLCGGPGGYMSLKTQYKRG